MGSSGCRGSRRERFPVPSLKKRDGSRSGSGGLLTTLSVTTTAPLTSEGAQPIVIVNVPFLPWARTEATRRCSSSLSSLCSPAERCSLRKVLNGLVVGMVVGCSSSPTFAAAASDMCLSFRLVVDCGRGELGPGPAVELAPAGGGAWTAPLLEEEGRVPIRGTGGVE